MGTGIDEVWFFPPFCGWYTCTCMDVWIYENFANFNTTTLTLSMKVHRLFHSINHRQCFTAQLTYPYCFCLASWLPTSKAVGHGWPRLSLKENEQFFLSRWPISPPLGLDQTLVSAHSQAPGLSVPTLLDGSLPGFSRAEKVSLLAAYCRIADRWKSFAPNLAWFS